MAANRRRAYAARVVSNRTVRGVQLVIIEEGTPVTRPAARPSWAVVVIAAVAILAIAMGAVAGAFLVGGRNAGAGAGPAAAYVPADAVMYVEARLDLPGDQRAMARAVLDRFEPIDTDALLGSGLADWLDQQLAKEHDATVSYSKDIAPWFSGEVAVALHDYPLATDPGQRKVPEAVATLGVTDASAASAFADRMRAEAQQRGASFNAAQHQGVQVWMLDTKPSTDSHFAYAVTSDQVLFGTGADAVERALDVHAGSEQSLDQRAELRRLAGRLPADRVGFVAFDAARMYEQLRADADKASPGLGDMLDEMMKSAPQFGVGAARFENDRLVFQMVADAATGSFAPSNAQRDLARWTPNDAIFFSDAGNLGPALTQFVRSMKLGAASAGVPQQQLDQVEAALGGDLESFVSWIKDGAMVAGWDGKRPYGGLILTASDADAARQRLGQLTALIRLAAGGGGAPITVSDETVDGVVVTTIRYHEAQALEGIDPSQLALQYAVTDARVVIGFGDRFVGRVLALPESESLAASERIRAAIAGVGGTNNAASSYLDIAALRGAIEAAMPADVRGQYEREVQPYVAPLDYLASVTRVDGSVAESKAAVVVR
jgi:hypothetical protein